jgi:cytochrome oxidase Cu insertion factor (SCO1/SenC/PrrC family)
MVLRALAVVMLCASVATAAPDFSAVQLERYESPKPAPDFSLPDLGGNAARLADFRGKVLLLFFWATW